MRRIAPLALWTGLALGVVACGAPLPPTPPPQAGAACVAANLAARVTAWEGAMGHAIAHVELANHGRDCLLADLAQSQLVDGGGAVLIDGVPAAPAPAAPLAAGATRTTMVLAGNYCGDAPAAPVSVAFVLPGDGGRLTATPVAPDDLSGLPSCAADPGSAGTIEMQPWTP